MAILIVDDDREIAQAVQALLAHEGLEGICAYNGLEALDILSKTPDIELILLDIMMPRMDGLSATLKIREDRSLPIILLSAKSENTDKVLGLSIGADDYITKPFHPEELVARVKSHLRRYLHWSNTQSAPSESFRLVNGELELNTQSKQLLINGDEIRLTPTEFKIMTLLMRHPGQVFSAEEIYSLVWNEEAYAVENTVMVHIRRIREKIEVTPKEPKYLKVVWGVGYKIEPIKTF